ncbi:MAG: FIST C-terminal domain-containing protein [Deferribacteraceae bacterium]|jgi:hypothetical protein|nr:FIST C-terminal domain-containing protein [Deferribacteraceae bacterium]
MIRTLTAYTKEPDNISAAISDIEARLNLKNKRLKNSFAIIFHHRYFHNQELLRALHKALKMDTIGISSVMSAVNGGYGEMILTVMVFTSDDAEFFSGLSEPLFSNFDIILSALYRSTAAKTSTPPRLMLVFSQPSYTLCGGKILDSFDETTAGLDTFGTISVTYPYDEGVCSIFYNGIFYASRVAIVLFCGSLDVSFSAWQVPAERFAIKDILVTKSRNNILEEFNGIPALTFLKEMGLIESDEGLALLSIPISVHRPSGEYRTLVMQGIADKRKIICHADVPAGSVISMGSVNHEDVIASMKRLEKEIPKDASGALIFSCYVRSLALGLDTEAEAAHLAENIKSPFLFAYSGGEFSPVNEHTGRRVNAFLNASIVGCFFK